MPDKVQYFDTSKIEKEGMGQAVDGMMLSAKNGRFVFERHWYDNNWFDDGYHFRFLSRQQNKIIDLTERANMYAPLRSIPKTSKQVREIANILTSQEYVPIVYPERVIMENYQDPNEYMAAKQAAKDIAKKVGHWIEEEFKEQDLVNKFTQMCILAIKHGVSFLQILPDAEREEIRTIVRDAFDVYLLGEYTDVEDSPFVIVGHPKIISEIKANEDFDEDQRMSISPDNRLASSEIKEAYMKARYGRQFHDDSSATVVLKEAYIKEHLCEANRKRISQQENGSEILKDKDDGDPIIRQCFVAGNIWLKDEYLELPSYPIVSLMLEPGPIYKVPMIERFMNANKSLDQVVSRIERFTHTMAVGVWTKRAGEQFNLSNAAGGQVIEYKTTPPTQANLAPMPAYVMNLVELLTGFINEQGTNIFSRLPRGITAYRAIEALKQVQFSELQMPNRMLKKTYKDTVERFMDLADRYFITQKTISLLEKGEPEYFDIIGKSAIEKRSKLKVPVEGEVTPISKDYIVDIDVQAGMAYTPEGRKAAAKEINDWVVQLVQLGVFPAQALNKIIETTLEAYQFGPTAEIMEALDKVGDQGNMTDQQLNSIKVALAQVFKDLQGSGVLPDTEHRVQESAIGAAQALKDTGVTEKAQPAPQAKPPGVSIAFKDLPPSGKLQAAAEAGIQLNPQEVAIQAALEATKAITSDKGQQTPAKKGGGKNG